MKQDKVQKTKQTKSTKILVTIMILIIIASIATVSVYLVNKYSENSEETSTKSSASSKKNNKNVSNGISKTVMIYMSGTDLESKGKLATSNLNDLMNCDIDYDNINIVLCAGGCKNWHTPEISSSETSIYEINEDGITKVEKQSKKDMGNGKTLTAFLDYVYDNYDTDEYYLMFWDHGGALYGLQQDELTGNKMGLKSLNDGLRKSEFNENGIKFDVVILNNCLMGSIETADILSNYADYMVASEDLMYGDKVIKTFQFLDGINEENTAIDIAKSYVNSYANSFKRGNEGITMSIIDLSKVDDIWDSMTDYFDNINLTEKNFKKMVRIRANDVYEYQKDSDYLDMVDLYELITEFKSINSDNKSLLKSIEDAVVYNVSTDGHSKGISIYFPESKYDLISIYEQLGIGSSYKDFLDDFAKLYKNKSSVKMSLAEKDLNKEEKSFTMQLTDEEADIYKKSEFMLFEKNSDGMFDGTYTVALISPYTQIDENGLITADLINKTVALVDENDQPILRLANLIELDRTDEYIKYALPVALEEQYDESDPTKIIGDMSLAIAILRSYNDGRVEIENYLDWNVDEDGRASTNGAIIDIYSGKYRSIKFLKHTREIKTDENGNYAGIGDAQGVYGEEFNIGEEFKFKNVELDPEKEYVGVLCVEDVYGEKHYSNVIDVEIK